MSMDTAEALTVWIGVFGTTKWIVCDHGTHFKCQLVKVLTDDARVRHHFITAYFPWANGPVERICLDFLAACKALLSEFGLPSKSWPRETECAQNVLNHAPRAGLGLRGEVVPVVYRTPLEVFTGQLPVRPLLQSFPPVSPGVVENLTQVRAQQLINIEGLSTSLD